MARTDLSMLEALAANTDRLTSIEEEKFLNMLSALKHGHKQELSPDQRRWAENTYLRLQLDAEEPSENLVSSGKVKKTSSTARYAFELQPKPLRPPGR
jgi:hypothetical protein